MPGRSRAQRGKPKPVFVVQRHDARRLHYDFRLERDGALASWAVPKGVPLEPGQRALAVHVEDHPLDYATFEGEIPKGEYGAGTVEIWDSGTYELVEEKKDGGLTVRLEGTRLQGLWTLIPAKLDGNPKNWLMVRKRDDVQKAEGDGRARRRYEVMLATLDENVPKGDAWLFEVKWDGYRALAYLRGGEVRLVSRNGNDLTDRFRGHRGCDSAGPEDVRTACWTARSARSTRTAGRASRRCSRGSPARRSSTRSSTCSRSTGSRSSTFRCASGGHGSSSCSTAGTRRSRLSEAFEDGDALLRGGKAAAPGGDRRQAGRLAVPAGQGGRASG